MAYTPLTSIYHSEIEPQIQVAISRALFQMSDELKDEIIDKATENVYSYYPTLPALVKRRYELENPANLKESFGSDNSLTIENTTVLQRGYGLPETDVVEQGLESYRQPFPRPFMDEALEDYVSHGKAESTLAQVLLMSGFSFTFTDD